MNRILTCGLVAWLGLGLCVAGSSGGPPRRAAPKAPPATARAAGPTWLAPVQSPPAQTVYRTEYLSAFAVPSPLRAAEQPDARPVVWVLDGAGEFHGCSTALGQANVMAGNPVELAVFPWTHGGNRLLLDQIDQPHAKAQGGRLAGKIAERRKAEPQRRAVIVAHSAGCAVALATAEAMPPDGLDRVILLAPSVSTGYDLRPALRGCREGIDVFCSKKDWTIGFVTRMVGTTDKFGAPTAGRHGFELKAGEEATGRLRQHFWTPEMAWTGHGGGHYGVYAPAFIRAYLFPLAGVR